MTTHTRSCSDTSCASTTAGAQPLRAAPTAATANQIDIGVVSDIICPWCYVGNDGWRRRCLFSVRVRNCGYAGTPSS
jgi:hypothetical protein